ncbi:MAG: PqqD family protein [Thermoanaerobaculales bacterium]
MKVRRTEEVAWRWIDREMVVVHLTRHRMYALDEAGGRIWEAMEAPLEEDRLVELLGDPSTAAFLADLAAEGLVESDGPLPACSALSPAADIPAPPRIEWREEVRRFAGQCSFHPAESPICNQNPFNS